MVRMTCHAGCLTAALIASVGLRFTEAPAAGPQPNRPVSIVAQSTKGTAGTGRRPIGERIAASSLPVRAPAAEAPLPPDIPNAPEPDELEVADHAPADHAPEVVDHGPAPDVVETIAPPATAAETDLAEADAEEPVAATDEPLAAEPIAAEPIAAEAEPIEASVAEAAVVTLPASVAESHVVQTVTAEAEAADATQPLADATEATATPAPAPAPTQPKPLDAVRGRLLNRIKGVFATRPRAGTDAVSPEGLAVSSSQPADLGAPQPNAADAPATEPSPESLATPARLEFDVRESRSLVRQGEQIVMRIAVRNVGGTTAERVTATLFFADGIEPVQAIGHTAEVFPGEVRFATVPELSPGSSVDLLVTAVGTRPGSVPYRGELACDQLAGLIAREGAVTVHPRRATLP
jgi:hypothetical protein